MLRAAVALTWPMKAQKGTADHGDSEPGGWNLEEV
jgi:hypothetical protein